MSSKPLAYQAFRRIMFARVISGAGSTMQAVAAGWLVLMMTGNPMDVGILAALGLAPSLIGSPVGGALADRFCPRKLITTLSIIQTIPATIMAVLAFTGTLTVPLIFILILAGAIPGSMKKPITSLVIPFTVPESVRPKAVASSSAIYNIALFVGAIAGGSVVQFIGAGSAFAFNAASFVVSGVIFATSAVLQSACDMAKAHRESSFKEGLQQGWDFPIFRSVIFGAGVFFLLVAPINQLMVVLADDHGEGAMYLGVLLAAITVGNMIGNRIYQARPDTMTHRQKSLAWGVALAALVVFLLGFSHNLVVDLLLLTFLGISWEFIYVGGISSLQIDLPNDIRGRTIGLFYLIVSGGTALGALMVGWLFQYFGVNPTLIVLGVLAGLVALFLVLRNSARSNPIPKPREAEVTD